MTGSKSPSSVRNVLIRTVRKSYNPLGFKKGYNFTLCNGSLPFLQTVANVLLIGVYLRRSSLRLRAYSLAISRHQ